MRAFEPERELTLDLLKINLKTPVKMLLAEPVVIFFLLWGEF
jgi:hypothetical protein